MSEPAGKLSRRGLLKAAAAAALVPAAGPLSFQTRKKSMATHSFIPLNRRPDLVRCLGPGKAAIPMEPAGDGRWTGAGVEVKVVEAPEGLKVTLTGSGVCQVQLRWKGDHAAIKHYLGDHWERGYGDLEWRGDCPNRVMPWYVMAHDGSRTHGYGVKTGAGALCFWTADTQGVSLWADVRCGGSPAELGGRALDVCTVVCREGGEGESPYATTRAFCHVMAPHPKLTDHPVYGTNDWNLVYGKSSADLILKIGDLVSAASPNSGNRPYSVIDEGWQGGPYEGKFGYGPWHGNPLFGDMAKVAERLREAGLRPGLWYRPLTPLQDTPQAWMLERNKGVMDPTIPEVREMVKEHFRRFIAWGYECIKHDFTTWDILGNWGFTMGAQITKDDWLFHDRTVTTAEVIKNLYDDIRESAGSAVLIGCNVIGHLAVGTHEVNRTGDDTSGVSWDRNRRMGVNCLAFRAPQHDVFFAADPDMATIARSMPWEMTRQWMSLVATSGAPLFVAPDPATITPDEKAELKRCLDMASHRQEPGEPLDWLQTQCPRHWILGGRKQSFQWMPETGSWPYPD